MAGSSKYLNADAGIAGPALDAAAVTPSDTADLARAPARGLFVGTGGNVKVDTVGGSTVQFNNVASGTVIPVQVSRVYATPTGSAASNIVALY